MPGKLLRRPLLLVLAILLLLLICPSCGAEEDCSSPERVLVFSRYLREEGDYLRAAAEFERYLLLPIGAAEKRAVLLETADCYRLGKDYARAAVLYRVFADENPSDPSTDSARYRIAMVCAESGKYKESLDSLDAWSPASQDYQARRSWLKSVDYLHLGLWEKAHVELESIQSAAQAEPLTAELDGFATRGAALKRKSPAVAGLLSALVPGAGKVYAGRPRDGVSSPIFVLSAAKVAADAFDRGGHGSTRGWFYSGLSVGYYLGSIYGSAAAAKLHNRTQMRDLLRELDAKITTALPAD